MPGPCLGLLKTLSCFLWAVKLFPELRGAAVCSELTEGLKKQKERHGEKKLDRGSKTGTQIDGRDMQREADTDRRSIERGKKSSKRGQDPAGCAYC